MEKLIVGLEITFIGMTIVFVILVLINLALNLMRVIFANIDQRAPAAAGAPKAVPAAPPAAGGDAGHLIAVLSAAIAAAEGTTLPLRTLAIRSVTQVGSGWKRSARAGGAAGPRRRSSRSARAGWTADG